MALNVINGTADQVIQNAGNWYAYDNSSIFLPRNGGTFNVTLGTTQDDVTHIDSLPMRADLLSVTGNGSNLTFSMTGDGVVDIHVQTPGHECRLDPGRASRLADRRRPVADVQRWGAGGVRDLAARHAGSA